MADEPSFLDDQDVIRVLPDQRAHFLQADPMHIRVVGDDGSTWEVPHLASVQLLFEFLKKAAAPSGPKFWLACTGTRLGYDATGVFIHENHLRRYFGVLRATASLSLTLDAPEAVPKTGFLSGATAPGCSSESLLGKLLTGIPRISEEARGRTLRALFNSVDKNGNGTLQKDELVSMMRKITPTMSGKDVMDIWNVADKNHDGAVNLNEFVTWLSEHPSRVREAIAQEFQTEADCVRASFRVWDTNGDGLITLKELRNVLTATCPGITSNEVKVLCMHMDEDKDGRVCYEEFVHFLFQH